MKSLSILILLGTTAALILSALFAVTPALAETNPEALQNQALVSASVQESAVESAPFTPTTGTEAIPLEIVESNEARDPGLVLSSAFVADIQKDTETAPAAQEAEAEVEIPAQQASSEALVEAPQVAADSLESFTNSVADGSGQIVGIYAEGVLAYEVGGQPSGSPGYITGNADEVTRFGLASDHGSQGFLAHNYLAGDSFHSLSHGQIITLVYGDGRTEDYQIQKIRSFQALQPNSTQSEFVDLDNGGSNLSASELFYQMYNSDNPVVLQTCIAHDGVSTWGRLFVIATPLG